MDEESVISVNSTNVTGNGSGSKSTSSHPQEKFQFNNLSGRHCTVLSNSKFKGVISQANGNWGAQIYVNHQRIWLGTFKSEKEAAMAYDSASLKLRSRGSPRNIPWTNVTIQEPNFQSQFSTETVLNMIKDGSYASKFADYLKAQYKGSDILPKAISNGEIIGKQLFRKELTPSDVGKLNRLVIPKKFAVKFFPQISEDLEQNGVQDADLIFFDRSKRLWKFRYCYWKSSQSYVFTRGWNRFVKEKGLRAKDIVIFSLLESDSGSDEVQNLCAIDVQYSPSGCDTSGEDVNYAEDRERRLLEMRLSCHNMHHDSRGEASSSQAVFTQNDDEENAFGQDKIFGNEQIAKKRKGLRLFGVQII